MVANKAFMYKAVPHGWPVAGKDLTIETLEFDLEAPPPPKGFTTRNFYAAFDPSQRGRMRDPKIASYSPAMTLGQPVTSVLVIGKVLKSDNDQITEGSTVMVLGCGTESYSAFNEDAVARTQTIEPKSGVPLTAYLGALGMTGMTAYGSLYEIGEPKKGETILVSGAAGAVGQMVGQFAVREGLTVIGSVGDDEKVKYLTEELGFTSAFNYKNGDLAGVLKKLAPDGLDIYYDNVGGELLDVALSQMKVKGRVVACGAISQYNNKPGEGYGVKNYPALIRSRIRWQGFLVYDENIIRHRAARDENVAKWIAEGSLVSKDHITEGMDNAIDGFLGMLKGQNLGKSILKIAEPE